jgi:hypothetical protein
MFVAISVIFRWHASEQYITISVYHIFFNEKADKVKDWLTAEMSYVLPAILHISKYVWIMYHVFL